MNIMLTSAGRRTYLVEYFKNALRGEGRVVVGNSAECPAFRVADEAVLTPEIYDDSYIPFLLDFCEKKRISLLVPLFDIDIPVLSHSKDEFARKGTVVVAPEPDVAEACNDKLLFFERMLKSGIPVPMTADSLDDAILMLEKGSLSFPLVVKPRWGMASIGVHAVRSEETLRAACTLIREEIEATYLHFETDRGTGTPFVIQQGLRGQEYGMDVVCDLDGSLQAVVVKRKLAMRSGETDSAEVVRDERLEALGRRLAAALLHPGNMDVDVFDTPEGLFVLEANARFGGGYPFTHASGVDVVSMLVGWVKGESVDESAFRPVFGTKSYKDISIVTAVQGEGDLCREMEE